MRPKQITCTLILIAGVLLASSPLRAGAAPQADPLIYQIYLTNVRDNTFTVSWTTDVLSNGSVTYGAGTPSITVNDPITSTSTHYVEVTGLLPNTTYQFYVASGASTDDNGGLYYQVTTGPSLLFSPGKTVWGYVYEADGVTTVPNALVYLQILDSDGLGSPGVSQWVSARSDGSGVWSFDLSGVRSADFQNVFLFTDGGDALKITGQGGIKGTAGVEPNPWVITTPATYPYQLDIHLTQNPTAVSLLELRAAALANPALPLLIGGGLALMVGLAWAYRKR